MLALGGAADFRPNPLVEAATKTSTVNYRAPEAILVPFYFYSLTCRFTQNVNYSLLFGLLLLLLSQLGLQLLYSAALPDHLPVELDLRPSVQPVHDIECRG